MKATRRPHKARLGMTGLSLRSLPRRQLVGLAGAVAEDAEHQNSLCTIWAHAADIQCHPQLRATNAKFRTLKDPRRMSHPHVPGSRLQLLFARFLPLPCYLRVPTGAPGSGLRHAVFRLQGGSLAAAAQHSLAFQGFSGPLPGWMPEKLSNEAALDPDSLPTC